MGPIFNLESVIFLLGSVSIPFLLLILLSPLYEYVDRERSRRAIIGIPPTVHRIPHGTIHKNFHERWLYTGSTEISICLLSATLLLAVSTSSRPSNYYFNNYPSWSLHTVELLAQASSFAYILVLTLLLVGTYRTNDTRPGTPREFLRTSYATLTMLAPGIFYILFRMEWSIQ